MACPSHRLQLSLRVRKTGRCMLTVYVGTEGAWSVCRACACGGGRQAHVDEPEDAAGARWSEVVQCKIAVRHSCRSLQAGALQDQYSV